MKKSTEILGVSFRRSQYFLNKPNMLSNSSLNLIFKSTSHLKFQKQLMSIKFALGHVHALTYQYPYFDNTEEPFSLREE